MLVLQSLLLSAAIDAVAYLKSIVGPYLYLTPGSEEKNKIELNSQNEFAVTLDEYGLRFWPPLYMQRYIIVQEVLEHPIWNGSIKKVVDFGCSELGLFKCIKPVPGLNNIMLVDIDFNLLDLNQTKIVPTTYDHLSMSERKEPLTVDIYNGSIADLDDRMLGVDAVICIELIEHLYSDVLNAIPHTVFEFIKPKLALFTTPNVEFNILFPNFNTQFRHDDHKFEWTRKQFKEWAKKIVTCYPDYAVQFDGIGAGPPGTEKLGCCSQMAIFYRKDMKKSPVKPIGCTPYKLLRRVSYPFEQYDENTVRERTIYDKLLKFVQEARSNNEYSMGDGMEIPLNVILSYISDCCLSIEELEKFVSKLYSTKKNDQGEWFLLTDEFECSSDEYKSNSDSYSNHSGEYSLLENTDEYHKVNSIDSNEAVNMSFSESKHCYSTPMTNRQEPNVYFSNIDSFNTVLSSSDLYKTAVDHDMSSNEDMEISSSCNSSIIVDNCNMYQQFLTGRNNSTIDEEDIRETEKTITCALNYDDNDIENDNVINDNNTVIQNSSNGSLKRSCTSDSAQEPKAKQCNSFSNVNEENIEFEQQPVFLHRALLDENGFTEKLLSIPDKKL